MSTPKDHYLPQFYLRGFATGERLCVFDRKRTQFRTQTVLNTASERGRYTLVREDGTKDRTIEEVLGRVESGAAAAIQKLARAETLTQTEKEQLAWLAAFFNARVPAFEASLNHITDNMLKDVARMLLSSPERTEELMREFDPEWEQSSATAEGVYRLAQEGTYDWSLQQNAYLESMMKGTLDVVGLLVQMDWKILHAPPGEEFITSDAPLAIETPDDWSMPPFIGVGLTTPGARKILPLSRALCLVVGDRGPELEHVDASLDDVLGVNEVVAIDSFRMVIGGDAGLLERIVESSQIESLPPAPNVQLFKFGPYTVVARKGARRPRKPEAPKDT